MTRDGVKFTLFGVLIIIAGSAIVSAILARVLNFHG